jgi:hypothetical protein
MDCNICYETFKEYELISGGCCTTKLCRSCISKLKECPTCKRKYHWIDHNIIKFYKIENIELKYKICQLEYDKQILIENKLQHSIFINELVISLNNKDNKIKLLMNRIDVLSNEIEKDSNISDFEEVIQKYNLNII